MMRMKKQRLQRLIGRGVATEAELAGVIRESENTGDYPEEILLENGVPRYEVLLSLAGYHNCPFVEYDESVILSRSLLEKVDMEELKRLLWVPLSVSEESAEVIAYMPHDAAVSEQIRKILHVEIITFRVALPYDIIRIIEHNQDVNPHFPPAGGRTPLAKVRTFFADRRSLMACQRTDLAKGRTGLAFIRTGVSFIAISLLLLRVFGAGYLSVIELLLFGSGAVMTVDGLLWYLPVRRRGRKKIFCRPTEPVQGTTVLMVLNPGNDPVFSRSAPVTGADELRTSWSSLSPVMRRRFLASDRTDFAEERNQLACYRTEMARARTGLAFTRTGTAFIGLGMALLRQFSGGPWRIFDAFILLAGTAMAFEGFFWYLPGRRAGNAGLKAVKKMTAGEGIWDFVFPPSRKGDNPNVASCSLLRKSGVPGIWATTGLALERTVLAERRNVMARFRTVMARSRTGMAFIRTGMSTFSVGLGLQIYFGAVSNAWTACNIVLMVCGVLFIVDGFIWHVPAETMRKEMPYCFGDMEIVVPDYGRPNAEWGKAVFTHDDV
ncbi:MAG: hypothetical protein EHM54_02395 [Nitrospiraceae bacterium]|nr:MAG: hypothetical protein EHM54_02395 [Nitrospiraceae bacterium]